MKGTDAVESREYTVPFTVQGNATVIAWSVKDGYYNSPRVRAELKSQWKETAHETLADTDTDGLIDFDTLGDCDWVFDPDNTSDGVNGSMRSGAIGPEGTSSMTANMLTIESSIADTNAVKWVSSLRLAPLANRPLTVKTPETTLSLSTTTNITEIATRPLTNTTQRIEFNFTAMRKF